MSIALPPPRLSADDLDHVLGHTQTLWSALRGERIFVTGGTGFFGCWLLESFCRANRQLGLGASLTALTRDPAAFRSKAPHLASDPAVTMLQGDAATFEQPPGEFAYVIHAATDSGRTQGLAGPLATLETILDGTRRVLEFSRQAKTRRLLYVSSGAVYGPQPAGLSHVPEEFSGAPDPLLASSAYGEGKRAAEALCALHSARSPLECTIARCFAFVGPHLPLDAHFAIGNFIRDAMAARPIEIQGDGTAVRSYLYAADLAIWLWTLLFEGKPGRAYNVGSEESVSILQLAEIVRLALQPGLRVSVQRAASAGAPVHRYVPSTGRARQELRLEQRIGLAEAIQRTAAWHGHRVAGA